MPSGRRAFAVKNPLPVSADGSIRLPRVLREATSFVLMDDNIKAEGIFRISGRAQTIEILKEAYNRGQKFIVWKEVDTALTSSYYREGTGHVWVEEIDHVEGYELHVAAALIKLWYKELREPIFPQSSYQALEKYYGSPNAAFEIPELFAMLGIEDEWSPISSNTSKQILKMHLLPLLSRVAAFQDRNQMTPENLAVCFAPSLLCGPDPIEDLKISTIVRRILVALIVHWESDLAPLFGTSFETFEDSLRMPAAAQDTEDPLEEAQLKGSDETQSIGITLLDNDDSDEEIEAPPALPPRPSATIAIDQLHEEPSLLDVGLTNGTDGGPSDSINHLRRKPSPFDSVPLHGMSQVDISAFTEASASDAGTSMTTLPALPVRRKPAPALLPLPRYSDTAVRYYDTVPIEDETLGQVHELTDADGILLYEEQLPVYSEPIRRPPSPPPDSDTSGPPPSSPPAAEPSIQRKPLPKPATWG